MRSTCEAEFWTALNDETFSSDRQEICTLGLPNRTEGSCKFRKNFAIVGDISSKQQGPIGPKMGFRCGPDCCWMSASTLEFC